MRDLVSKDKVVTVSKVFAVLMWGPEFRFLAISQLEQFLSVSLRASEAEGPGPTLILGAPEVALPIFCRPHCPWLPEVP